MTDRFDLMTVGEIVAEDFRRAAVFERFGIDFCCNGKRLVGDACRSADVEAADVVQALDALPDVAPDEDGAARWSVTQLIDHIVSTHHVYVRATTPTIAQHLAKLGEAHGARHPELLRVAAYFDQVRADLAQHMMKEERVLFPYVADLDQRPGECGVSRSPFGTVENPIRMMEREHAEAGDALRIIRELTRGYSMPDDGCTTYRVTMAELLAFERDLHRHIHLENNILFPAAIRLERQLCGATEH